MHEYVDKNFLPQIEVFSKSFETLDEKKRQDNYSLFLWNDLK